MSDPSDLRLIEDYLPIEAISAEASREKSVRKGHISTLHLWWARRPLVACRAAVYGALVPADRWVKDINLENPPEDEERATKTRNGKKKGLNRKAAKEFVTKLCRYPKTNPTAENDVKIKLETEAAIAEAQRHILEAHAERLTAELCEAKTTSKPPAWVAEFNFTGERVTFSDIVAGRAPRPRVLDMFAGGGAIPLEALRLGCEAYSLDLNPVAHIIQLCTLVYPQRFGKSDLLARGMTGPKNARGESTWGGLADEVRYWGRRVLDKVRKEIGDIYPPIPDPTVWDTPPEVAFDRDTGQWTISKPGKAKRGIKFVPPKAGNHRQLTIRDEDDEDGDGSSLAASQLPLGLLQPIAYLWTRTVRCKNPACSATVPLVRQTWLCKKDKHCVALRMRAPTKGKKVRFEVVESDTVSGLDFDPTGFSSGGNATCPFCGTVADIDYVKEQGRAQRMAAQLMAVVCTRSSQRGKVYVAADAIEPKFLPDEEAIRARIGDLCRRAGLTVPDEPIANLASGCYENSLGITVRPYGITTFGHLFLPRQMLCLLTYAAAVRDTNQTAIGADHVKAVATYLGILVDRLSDYNVNGSTWESGAEFIGHYFTRQTITMLWDFAELDPFGGASGSPEGAINWMIGVINSTSGVSSFASVTRGTATAQPYPDGSIDAVITDPPYYDNVPYADISDFFYVWLKRTVGHLYPEHFAASGTPKKQEAIADATRHGGDIEKANGAYEDMMAQSLAQANRVLKPGGTLAVVYAHKTTLGWSTLVDAFRRAGFVITEAWPLDTERKSRLRGMNSAALASSIFLVGRKRYALELTAAKVGNYEEEVQPELEQIVRERVETLWEMGIAGADLVIACVGAGLRAFTKYEKVEYANGEEVPAEKFLAEVEGVVLDTMMGKLFGQVGATVSAIDAASRFYILWRFVYKISEIDAGEAIVFTYAQHVELDGQQGLSTGKDALVEKKKAKYRARDYSERGVNEKLGLPADDGRPAPLIDVLHRMLWLMDNSPRKLAAFLIEVQPDRERLRVLAQALGGAALSGKSEEDAVKLVSTTTAEQAALGKLLANWRSLVESAVVSKEERVDRKAGQQRIEFD